MVEKSEQKKTDILLGDLRDLERYVRELLTFSPLPLCFMSPIGVILEVNLAFERISGFKVHELIGKPIEEIFEEKEIKELSKQTFEKGFVRGREVSLFTKEKKKVPVRVFTQVRKDEEGNKIGYFLGAFDLTEIKKTEKDLRDAQAALLNILEDTELARRRAEEERDKTRSIITNLMDGLLFFDKEKKLVLINPQAENFLKVRSGKIVGKSIPEISRFKNFRKLIALFGKEMKKVFRKEWKVRKDFFLEVSTVPLIAEREKRGNLVILHDVTREKIVERLKTEFVSLAAHQLRTPLSAIKWTLRMLLDGDLGKIRDEQRKYLEKTYRSNERMIKLINDLLNVARIEEGRYVYKPVLTDIEEICQSVIKSHKEEIERKGIKFGFKKLTEKLPNVKVDLEKMRLAVDNLLENAISYTKSGGEIEISLGFDKEKKKIKFSIKDTGIGIPKDQQERVFTKFFRGANAMRLETEGTGLGLFVTKNIIEAHGGKIWFESEEGKGTTFYFNLPVKTEFEEF